MFKWVQGRAKSVGRSILHSARGRKVSPLEAGACSDCSDAWCTPVPQRDERPASRDSPDDDVADDNENTTLSSTWENIINVYGSSSQSNTTRENLPLPAQPGSLGTHDRIRRPAIGTIEEADLDVLADKSDDHLVPVSDEHLTPVSFLASMGTGDSSGVSSRRTGRDKEDMGTEVSFYLHEIEPSHVSLTYSTGSWALGSSSLRHLTDTTDSSVQTHLIATGVGFYCTECVRPPVPPPPTEGKWRLKHAELQPCSPWQACLVICGDMCQDGTGDVYRMTRDHGCLAIKGHAVQNLQTGELCLNDPRGGAALIYERFVLLDQAMSPKPSLDLSSTLHRFDNLSKPRPTQKADASTQTCLEAVDISQCACHVDAGVHLFDGVWMLDSGTCGQLYIQRRFSVLRISGMKVADFRGDVHNMRYVEGVLTMNGMHVMRGNSNAMALKRPGNSDMAYFTRISDIC